MLQLTEGYQPKKDTLRLVSPELALIVLVAIYSAVTLQTVALALRDARPSSKVSPGTVASSMLASSGIAWWSLLYDLATCGLMLAALLVKSTYSAESLQLGNIQR